MVQTPQNVLNQHDPSKNYETLLLGEDEWHMGQTFNEMQSAIRGQIARNANALLSDGNLVTGGAISVDPITGDTAVEAAQVFAAGLVRVMPSASFVISVSGLVEVGIVIESRVISSIEDPDLIFDYPAISEAHGQPLPKRMQEKPRWGHSGEPLDSSAQVDIAFYPVYQIQDGVVVDNAPPPQISPFEDMLARYDREAHGNYSVLDGFVVTAIGYEAEREAQAFLVSAGTVNVEGYKIVRTSDLRVSFAEEHSTENVEAEGYTFASAGSGTVTLTLNNLPVSAVNSVIVTQELTENITRGPAVDTSDLLSETSTIGIVSVIQAATTYVAGVDYEHISGAVKWLPGGAEPASSSTYEVVYRHFETIAPDAVTENGVTISGGVDGELVLVDYDYILPRVDAIVCDRDGVISRTKGQPSRLNPLPPSVPSTMLRLADVYNVWKGVPRVEDRAVSSLPFLTQEQMLRQILDTTRQVAYLSQLINLTVKDPAAKLGLFSDPLHDDDLRDAGIVQSAAIIGGALTTPITTTIETFDIGGAVRTLAFADYVAFSQPLQTRDQSLNPFSASLAVPMIATLQPAIDQWTVTNALDVSTTTRRYYDLGGALVNGTNSSNDWQSTRTFDEIQTIELSRKDAQFLRPIVVQFSVDGMGSGEELMGIDFDGVGVAVTGGIADANGDASGTFTIPANIPAGSKTLEFYGKDGFYATATFLGEGVITQLEKRTTTITEIRERQRQLPPSNPPSAPAAVSNAAPSGGLTRDEVRDVLLRAGIHTSNINKIYNGGGNASAQAWVDNFSTQINGHGGAAAYINYQLTTYGSARTPRVGDLSKHVSPNGKAKPGPSPYDPVAQTHWFEEPTQVVGFRVRFTQVGGTDAPIIGALRGLTAGNPDRTISRKLIDKDSIVVDQWHDVIFDRPHHFGRGENFALQIGSNDADNRIAAAEIGKRDHTLSRFVTEQAAPGVFMLSPNGVTWTAEQTLDMTFEVIARQYTETRTTIAVGTLSLTGETHLACVAPVEEPEGTNVAFKLTRTDGSAFWMQDGSSVELGEEVTDDLTVEAVLSGSASVSPLWTPQVTFVKGKRQATGNYVTRGVAAGTAVRVRVIFETNAVSGSSVAVGALVDEAVAVPVPEAGTTPVGNGYFEHVHELTGVTGQLVRAELTLANDLGRPIEVRKPQVVVTQV